MIVTHSYRVLPTKRQRRVLERILEGQRQLYNAGLEERIDAYRKSEISRSYIDQCRALTEWRQSDSDATSIPVTLQRWTLKLLDEAYQGFFRRLRAGSNPGFPRFRGKGRFNSFGFRQFSGIRFEDARIRFKGMPGSLRIHLHRRLPEGSSIRSCVFRRDVKGWTVGLMFEKREALLRRDGAIVGLDLGISTFAALSDGGFIPSLRAARRAERRLRVLQRALARKRQGSRGRCKARIDVVRRHRTAVQARANHLHQATARLVRDYRLIVIERLNVKGLARSVLAKDVRDASWGKFISMLRYKAACAGTRLIEVDPQDTSQECSRCGVTAQKTLHDRIHTCSQCGLTLDRDLNAARNILRRAGVGPGLHNVAGCGMRADGNLDEIVGTRQLSLRPN